MKAKDRSIKTSGKHTRQVLARASALLLGLYFGAACELVLAGPEGGEVVRGEGLIGQAGATTTISQQSQRLLLEWQSFNVGANENVIFNQPGSTAVALNQILDQNASEILGAIDANGRVFLMNPNGIIFGSTATVNVGALVASSLNIDYDDFMVGNYDFETLADGTPGVVVNRGLLQASTGGSITLMGDAVSNEGLILAELGDVTLAAGSSASLDFDGDGLLFFEVTGEVLENTGVLDAAVSNSGEISADGGRVLLTASTAKDVFSNVVNNDGVIRAQRIDNTGGVIRLVGSGGNTISGGIVDASAGDSLSTGGDVQILGDRVGLVGEAVVDASGATGGGSVKIGGGFQGKDSTVDNAASTFVGRNVSISADAGTTGNGGEVIVWSDEATRYHGNISSTGGSASGDGGFVEVSGKEHLDFDGNVMTSAASGETGTLLLDPTDIYIIDGAENDGDQDANVDPQLTFGEADTADNTVSVGRLQALFDTNIVLQATNEVRVGTSDANGALAATVNLPDLTTQTLTLSAGDGSGGAGDVTFNSGSSITTGGGGVTINAGTNGDTSGTANLGSISTSGGTVTVDAIGSVVVGADINAGVGQIDISVDTDEALTDGAESLEIQAALTAGTINLDGGATTQNDSLIVSLTGSDTADWDINAPDAGNLDTSTSDVAAFTNFSDLTGGAQADDFGFADGTTLSGNVAGGAGSDTLDLSDHDPGTDAALNTTLTGVDADDGFAGTVATGVPADVTDFTGIDVLVGSDDAGVTDTLTGQNADSFVAVSGTDSGTYDDDDGVTGVTAAALAFNDVEALVGGTAADTFDISGNFGGSITGDAGDDVFVASGGTATTITGGADTDMVRGTAGDDVFDVTNDDEITVAGQVFTSVESAEGVGGDDQFVFADGTTLSGNVAGGADTDTLDLSDHDPGTDAALNTTLTGVDADDGFAGTVATGVPADVTDFTGIDVLVGSDDAGVTDTLTGQNADSFVAVSGTDSGTYDDDDGVTGVTAVALAFSDVEAVEGGTEADTFNLDSAFAGTIDGGEGSDSFVIADGVELSFAGTAIDGGVDAAGDDTDTLDVSADADVLAVTLSGSTADEGFAGTEATVFTGAGGGFDGIDAVAGSGDDTLTGRDVDSTWTETTYNDGTETLTFSGMDTAIAGATTTQTLEGDDGGVDTADTFETTGAGLVTLNGQDFTNIDVLDADQGATEVDTFTLNTSSFGGSIIGGAGTDVFNINQDQAGQLDGGEGSDSFVIADGVELSFAGTAIDGGVDAAGDDTDTLDVSADADVLAVTLSGSTADEGFAGTEATVFTGAGGGFDGIDAVAGSGDDTLTGRDVDSTWTETTYNDGTEMLTFSGMDTAIAGATTTQTLEGDDGGVDTADTFETTGAGLVTLNGQDFTNIDVLDADQGATEVDTFTLNTSSFGGSIIGGAGTDVFNINQDQAGQLDGGEGSDSFVIADGVELSFAGTAIDGGVDAAGDDTDTLDVSADADVLAVTLSGSTADEGFAGTEATVFTGAGGGFDGIDAVAGSGDDTLTGRDVDSTWTETTYNDGTETLTFSGMDTAIAGATTTQTLEGDDGGVDTADTFETTGAGLVTLNGQDFTNIDVLDADQGATEVDTFTLNTSSFGGSIIGGAGTDVFNINQDQAGQLDGGEGSDSFVIADGVELSFAGTAIDGGVDAAGDDTDTLDVSADADVLAVTLSGSTADEGFAGTEATVFTGAGGGFDGIDAVAGSGDDTLTGRDVDSTWTETTYNDGTEMLTFSGMDTAIAGATTTQTLEGDDGGVDTADTFETTGAGLVTLNGQDFTNIDVLDADQGATEVDTFTLNTSSFGGSIIGGAGTDVFNINQDQAGQLDGGEGSDSFVIADGVELSFAGTAIDGGVDAAGDDTDTLDVSADADVLAVTLSGSTADEGFAGTEATVFTGAGGGFDGIDAVAGSGDDTLTGRDVDSTWTETTYNDGTETLTFSGMDTAIAGATTTQTLEGDDGGVDTADTFETTGAGLVTLNGQDFTNIDVLDADQGATEVDTFTLNTSSFGGSIIGGAGTDVFNFDGGDAVTVTGGDGDDTFNLTDATVDVTAVIDGGETSESSGDTIGLVGATGGTFTITGANSDVTLTAGTGSLSVTNVENASGSSTGDVFNMNGSLSGTADGNGGSDEIFGVATPNTFVVNAPNAGTVNGTAFVEVENLTGGAAADEFTFTADLSGTASGAGGNDTFNINDGGTVNQSISGGSGNDQVSYAARSSAAVVSIGAFNSIASVVGSGQSDTLQGTGGANLFSVNSTNSGVVGGISFSSFESISGLGGNDTFNMNAGLSGAVSGGTGSDEIVGTSGPDTFIVSSTNAGTVNGTSFTGVENLSGMSGVDSFSFDAAISGTAAGGSGNDTFDLDTGGGAGTLAGGTGSDQIFGAESANSFSVTAADTGSVNGSSFTSIENLTGGAAGDTFSFSAALSGTAAGAGGNDTFILNAGADASSLAGESGSDEIVGGSSPNTFVVSAANAGTANGISFTSVENLTGGAAADQFTFNADLSGTADGAGEDDTFNLNAGGAGAIDGGANGSNGDVIVGADSPNTFVVNATDAGTVNGNSFTNVENLIGGAADDTFNLNADLSGTMDGNAGSDGIVGTPMADAFAVNATDAGTVNGTSFASVENLDGGAGDDTFNMNADLSGTVDGGAGSDEIVGAASANTFIVNAMNAGTVNGTDFTNIENLTGGAAADAFTFAASLTGTADGAEEDDIFNLEPGGGAGTIDGGANGANGDEIVGIAAENTFVVNALDAGTANGSSFTNVENLTGGAAGDTFNMNADLSGTVDGGAGSDEIVGAATANTFVVSAADAGTVNATSFVNVENLTGGAAADEFTFAANLTGEAAGNDSDDTFAFVGGSAALVSGGAGNDTFVMTSSGFAGTAQGDADNDLFDVDASTSGDLLGGDGDDTFSIADNVVASGMVDGEAGAADMLDLSEYSSNRNVTLVASDADGFDGTEASVSNGFANINDVQGSVVGSGDSLTGLDAAATWQIVGDPDNVYSSDGNDLGFTNFEVLAGGADVDTFALGGGSVTGDLAIEGNGGPDAVGVVADFDVSNDLSISGVESVTSDAGATLGANELSIAGATGGIGTADDPLQTDIGSLQVSGSGDVYLDEANALDISGIGSSGDVVVTATGDVTQTGDVTTEGGAINLTASSIVMNDGTAATSCAGGCTTAGNISYASTGGGDIIVGLLDAGDPSADSDLSPDAGNSGTVTLTSTNGNILNGNAVGTDNVRGSRAILNAPSGGIGTQASPIRVIVPLIQGTATIIVSSSLGAVIDNPNLAEINAQAGNVIDPVKIAVSTAVGASVLSALEEIGYVDWAGLDPNVRLVDCLEPCIKLPPDQLEDEELAGLREPTQMLVIPTIDGVKLIPVYVETIARKSWDIGEAGY